MGPDPQQVQRARATVAGNNSKSLIFCNFSQQMRTHSNGMADRSDPLLPEAQSLRGSDRLTRPAPALIHWRMGLGRCATR